MPTGARGTGGEGDQRWELNKNHANRRFGPHAAGNEMSTELAPLARLVLRLCMRMRETRGAGTKGGRDAREESRGKGYSSSSPKPSRAKKRNGRKTAFIKLSADVHHPSYPPSSCPPFTPWILRAFAQAIPPPRLLLSCPLFSPDLLPFP